MSRFFTLKNIIIALAIALIVSAGLFLLGTFLQNQPVSPQLIVAPTPSSSTGSTQTGVTVPTQLTVPPMASSPVPSPTSPPSTSIPLMIPPGFRVPEEVSYREPFEIEPILPSLTPDPETQRLSIPDKDLLFFQLSKVFYYDPDAYTIIEDTGYQVRPTIIDFGHFDPEDLTARPGDNLLWFNQHTVGCKLKTDPKSPFRIEREIGSQEMIILQLYDPGKYLFFCQGLPGSTQTIVITP